MEAKSTIKIVFGMVYDICPHCESETKRDAKLDELLVVACPSCSKEYQQISVMESLENESFSFTNGCDPSGCGSCPLSCH